MKKALALVLALVLALSMAVSAFALTLKDLSDLTPADPAKKVVTVVDADNKEVLYTDKAGTYYIALTNEAWYDVKVTTNGNVTAKLVEFDPETMIINGNLVPTWALTEKGKVMASTDSQSYRYTVYEDALAAAKDHNDTYEVTFYGIKLITNVNVIEITVEDNYGVHYTEGLLEIAAKKKVDGVEKNFGGEISFINDVVNFEYEEVKNAAASYADKKVITVGQFGYSDYDAYVDGYDTADKDYDYKENRVDEGAAVVSTTAFRAIEGKNLKVVANDKMSVVLKEIVAGQKGVNFSNYYKLTWNDKDKDLVWDRPSEELVSIDFGFLGEQVVKGAYEITINTGYDWFQLRELFGLQVEEDDIISYYLVDENGKVVGGKEVDYMTANVTEIAKFTIKGENAKLGNYKLVLEVPAAEAGEANPNTGAESVVGVVAALAVVSVATAAAVSLKK